MNQKSTEARPYVLEETNWKFVKDTNFEVALLPWGATEAHNYHLPYGTDNIQASAVAIESAKRAWERGAKIVVLPTIPFGVNTGQLDIRLDINMNPSTQMHVLKDVITSLNGQGIHKFVIVNGHGGNNFKQILRELIPQFPKMFIGTLNWYDVCPMKDFFDEPGDHAGEMETSVVMHLTPQWVRPLFEAGSGSSNAYTLSGLNEGWVWTQRSWSKATIDTGVGNPSKASEVKGERYFEAVVKKLSAFLVDLANLKHDELYEKPQKI